MWQPVASPAFIANSTTWLLSTGRVPGIPMQTGQHWVLGGAPKVVGQSQKILAVVLSSTCTSSPMTISYPL